MILDLDIGNSRIKWLLRDARESAVRGVCSGAGELIALLEERGIRPQRVRASCVGARVQVDELNAWLSANQLPRCELAVTRARSGPVVCGYQQPQQMGVDRWLAVCAAWRCVGGPCVVADAGSALTIDFINNNARHLGGYIVPGLAMQQASLLSATENVRYKRDSSIDSVAPGASTGQAVTQGVVRMLVALVEGAVSDLAGESGVEVTLVLTGGDAPVLGQFLSVPYILQPDLVIQGIELLLE